MPASGASLHRSRSRLVRPALPPTTPSSRSASVSPKQGFTDSAERRPRSSSGISGSAAADVTIRIVRLGRTRCGRIDAAAASSPATERVERWDGLTDGGRPVADGTYRVVVGVAGGGREGGGQRRAPPATSSRSADRTGPAGRSASSTRRATAAAPTRASTSPARCGTPLAAAVTGTVVKRAYDARLDGNFIVIRGLGEKRKYWYAHMVHPLALPRGDLVHVGEIVGHVGRTGNARTVGCHLHFEIHVNGDRSTPPYLRAGTATAEPGDDAPGTVAHWAPRRARAGRLVDADADAVRSGQRATRGRLVTPAQTCSVS